ncbi:peptide chain release factor N(5)-glutamine methyltransferase [Anaeromyxobacter sp. Fw109-5]|uniref:peptide chain release factor N(5)-glutamine methyltransferase n=1 Tax=Anaeromyxobacter sp. (strain Fw109-5) TaxID=404589 RepID=UPI0000ED6F03|nr:peptide chain release factor N(5)-glutamine methyltransferase [Anaeromyxobacter sp. Fw109-5]ABS28392.1 modification methylase, HemK family [Anaeromyxobacter sp. Fw109-5]
MTWTPLKLLAWTQEFFAKKGVDSPRLTAEVLLARALSCDRVRLYLDFDKPLGDPELAVYRELVRRRAEGEPTAYLVGKREFYGRDFAVDARVLVPRPETELLVEAALAELPRGGRLLDLCTGSGAIGVTVALERPDARVLATDASEDALAVARENASRLGAVVELAHGDLWAAVHGDARFEVIASNPPYVPAGELAGLAPEVRREPCIALDGGFDGLAVLRRIVSGAPGRLVPGGALLLEMHERHLDELPRLCLQAGFERAEARRDLAGLPRLVVAHMAGGPRPA